MAEVISLELPYPVSINAAYANNSRGNGRGRFKTQRLKAWIAEATVAVLQQKPGRIKGRYAFHMVAQRPDNRTRDLSNLLKTVEDLCVSLGLVEDDHKAAPINLDWSDEPPTKDAKIKVWLISRERAS